MQTDTPQCISNAQMTTATSTLPAATSTIAQGKSSLIFYIVFNITPTPFIILYDTKVKGLTGGYLAVKIFWIAHLHQII